MQEWLPLLRKHGKQLEEDKLLQHKAAVLQQFNIQESQY